VTMGLTEEQAALAGAVADWAGSAGFAEVVRAAEHEGPEPLLVSSWKGLAELGVLGVAVPETHGGAGGTFLDLAVALEAAAHGLVPGPLLSVATTALLLSEHADSPISEELLPGICDGSVRVGAAPAAAPLALAADDRVSGTVPVVLDAGAVTHVLVGALPAETRTAGADRAAGERWAVVPVDAPGVNVEVSGRGPDLSRTVGSVRLDDVVLPADAWLDVVPGRVGDLLTVLASAEASGTARWALETAVAYAGIREQFGRKIGSFQAIKHLCAQMLERAESATAVAWGAAVAEDDPDQLRFAAAVAGAVGLDAAVDNAKDCIQVLGGIGFTWEHDAHLHLRRALGTRQLLGGTDRLRHDVSALALDGVRRRLHVDLGEDVEDLRRSIRSDVDRVREARGAADRRTVLAETGLLAPHWPPPYGRGADPRTQLVIDDELEVAGVTRPDLAIGAWAAPTILGHGTDGQKERFVPPTLRGEIVWCQLFSEPGAGSDLASLRTRAERVEGGWRLTGQKVWTSLAAEADWAICLARTDPDAPQHKGITYFLVDMRSPGIEVRPLREITGEAVFNEVFLDGVMVPDDGVVGQVDDGWRLARTTLANERVAMSGSSLGANVERALRLLDGAGAGPGDGAGNIAAAMGQVRVGAAVADAVTVQMLGLRSTLRSLAGQGPGAESSVQKLVGVRHRQEAAELVYDLMGPEALLGEAGAEEALRELLLTRCLSIAGGTTQVLRNVAAERILGLPRG
jgi:3-oxochol-4-en-24-oyl-CoA dehydrogenase